MPEAHVLVVDDDAGIRALIRDVLEMHDFAVEEAKDGRDGLARLESGHFDLVLSDLDMEPVGGLQFLRKAKEAGSEATFIMVTAFATVDSAVDAMKDGAFDYISKPFNTDDLVLSLQRALEARRIRAENAQLKRQLRGKYKFENMVGTSDAIQQVFQLVEKVADTDSTILLTGESGTGKELVARAIHYASRRAENAFVAVNCGAIPRELLESELFGHEKGAFTGAYAKRIGRFEYAGGGTILLDEVAEMPPELQVKLLRVLQEKEFTPVGGVRPQKANVRVVAATNQDLEEAVRERRFREDLFFRLNVIPIALPPLRARRDDIPLLVEHFRVRANRDHNRSVTGFAKEALDYLLAYAWPGNVRELENLIDRVIILKGEGEIAPENLPDKIKAVAVPAGAVEFEIPDGGIDFNRVVDDIETRLIVNALRKAGGNKNQAAKLLSLNRTTLVEKIKKKRIDGHDAPELLA